MCRQRAGLPSFELGLQGVKNPRDGRRAGMLSGQCLHDFADTGRAGAEDKHLADGGVQGRLPALVALKDLRPKAAPRAWHGQILTLTGGGDQVAGIVAIALIPARRRSSIARCADKSGDFLFQDDAQGQSDGRAQLLVQRFLKIDLTQRCGYIRLRCRSGGHRVLGLVW